MTATATATTATAPRKTSRPGVVVNIETARRDSPQMLAKQAYKNRFHRNPKFLYPREWSYSYARGERRSVRNNLIARVWRILHECLDPSDLHLPEKYQGFIWIGVSGVYKEGRGTLGRNTIYRCFDILEREGLLQRMGGKGGNAKGNGDGRPHRPGRRNTGLMRLVYHPGLAGLPGADAGFGLPADVRGRSTSEIVDFIYEQREAAAMARRKGRIKRRRGVLHTGLKLPEGARVEAQIIDESTGEIVAEFAGRKAKSKCALGAHESVLQDPNIGAEVTPQQLTLPGILTGGRDGKSRNCQGAGSAGQVRAFPASAGKQHGQAQATAARAVAPVSRQARPLENHESDRKQRETPNQRAFDFDFRSSGFFKLARRPGGAAQPPLGKLDRRCRDAGAGQGRPRSDPGPNAAKTGHNRTINREICTEPARQGVG